MMLKVSKQLAFIKDGQLVLDYETLLWVRETFPRSTVWAVVFGVGRGGKSTLCKLLSNAQFVVSNKSEACTNGVWLSEPVLLPDGRSLVVVDSEGTALGDTSFQHKILAFACLLACNGGVLIHNDLHYSNDAMTALAKLASSMKLLRGLEQENWPALCFRVRDCEAELEVNGIEATPDELFAHLLQDVGDSHDIDRQLIRKSFETRKMFVTPHFPKKERDFLADHHKLPEGDFKDAFEEIRTWMLRIVKEKKVGGMGCDGTTLAIFLELCVKCINEGGDVSIPSVMEATMDSICSKSADEALNSYKSGMKQIFEAKLFSDDVLLQTTHEEQSAAAIRAYTKYTDGFFQKSVNKLLEALKTNINEEYHELSLLWQKAAREEAERLKREEQLKREEAEKRLQEEKLAKEKLEQEAETIRREEQLKREEIEKRLQEEKLAKEKLEQQLAQTKVACKHEHNHQKQETVVTNTAHHGKWGGYLHGHHCCGKCAGKFRCNGSCKGICSRPRTHVKTTLICDECGFERAQ